MTTWLPSLIRLWIASCSLIAAVKKIPRTVLSVKRIETNAPWSESMPLSTCSTVLPFTPSYLVIAGDMRVGPFLGDFLMFGGAGWVVGIEAFGVPLLGGHYEKGWWMSIPNTVYRLYAYLMCC